MNFSCSPCVLHAPLRLLGSGLSKFITMTVNRDERFGNQQGGSHLPAPKFKTHSVLVPTEYLGGGRPVSPSLV